MRRDVLRRSSVGLILPVGSYDFGTVIAGYNLGQQRDLSANISVEWGTFYNGDKTTLNVARGRTKITNQLSAEPTYSYNRVSLVQGDFATHLLGSRIGVDVVRVERPIERCADQHQAAARAVLPCAG